MSQRSAYRCESPGGGIRAATTERSDPPARPDPLKTRHHGNLTLGQATSQLGDIDLLDARFAVDPVGAKGDLPAQPRARIDPEVLERERQQTGGHLLAGRDDHVILARVMHEARLA